MKKIFAVILSLTILVLSAVPCTDEDDFAGRQSQTVTLSVAQSAEAVFDVCNPFFFCHTGHNAFVQSDLSFMEFTSTPIRLISENLSFIDIWIYSPVWRPPKA